MGHGASSPKSSTNPLFISHEVAQASTYLAEDEKFRELFINFVKSGLWIERLAQLVPEDTFVLEPPDISLFAESNFSFRNYSSTKSMAEMQLSTKEWSSSKRTTSSVSANSPKNSSKSVAPPSEYFHESYVNIEDFRCFNSSQLISILTHVLYPLFITHSDSDGSSLSGAESTSTELRDAMGLRRPKRVQEVFLGIAAYFSEHELHRELQDPSWAQLLPHMFDSYSLCITISDASQEKCPIIYANKAFLTLTNFAPGQLQDQNFNILNGPNTEDTQIQLLDDAVKNKRAAKIAITHYAAGGKKEFPNFIALKPSGKYVIAVHFVPSRLTHVDDVKVHFTVFDSCCFIVFCYSSATVNNLNSVMLTTSICQSLRVLILFVSVFLSLWMTY